MARVVFFSFDYDDVFRVNQVRNSGRFVGEDRSGFRDKAEYEQVKRQGDRAISNWIRRQMHGCSVTCVLIGEHTHKSKWVHFEIEESIANGMGLLGLYIHRLFKPGASSYAWVAPHNPLEDHRMPPRGSLDGLWPDRASDRFETHTWQPANPGIRLFRHNDLGAWVEEAADRAGR
ncbi:MAG: hypothetical protein F4Y86_03770 [Gammaproteobacteria bacterium]|nr:hypothetical protein [Gammaproteobacteria bacterium]